jgi:putative zinc finger/helix-turn-helix YgiT family protein
MLHGTVEHEFSISGVRVKGSLPATICPECGENTVEADALSALELAAAHALAKSAVRTGEVFRFMRKALGLRAADVGELLGADPATISRWEREHQNVDLRAFALLAELVEDRVENRTGTLERLKRLAHPPTSFPPFLSLSQAS